MAATAVLEFEITNFNGRKCQQGRTASSCQISSKSLEPRPKYSDFSIFFKMAAVRHLGFVMQVLEPPTKGIWWSYHCANCGWNRVNRRNSFDNTDVFRFSEFGLKTPIHAQKLFCFWFDPIIGEPREQIPKGTSLRESASFNPSCVIKIRRRVWPVSEFLEKGV